MGNIDLHWGKHGVLVLGLRSPSFIVCLKQKFIKVGYKKKIK